MKYLILVLMIALTACGEQLKNVDQTIQKEAVIDNFQLSESDYVILDYKSDEHKIFINARPTTLSKKELSDIERIIGQAIRENNEKQHDIVWMHNIEYPENQISETGYELEMKGYKRQYVPVLNSKGQKEIWVNFFCEDFGLESWKHKIMSAHDGGNCFFNLKVNLATNTYLELSINGYA